MRHATLVLILSVLAGFAGAEPANDTIRGLEECFALTRTADAICDNPANDAAVRLDCLQQSRNAQQQCLEHVRAGLARSVPPPTAEPTPSIEVPHPPPESASNSGKAAEEPSDARRNAGRSPAGDLPQDAQGVPRPSLPLGDAPPGPKPLSAPASRWIVSQTASPVDYSPLLVAELPSLRSSNPNAPSSLVLRCRAAQTEISVRTQGTWRPSRAGDVGIVVTDDGRPAQRFRWRLTPDDRSASSAEDAADIVQGLGSATLAVAVADATGEVGTATFELAGIEAVRDKLAAACRWPSVGTQSRSR